MNYNLNKSSGQAEPKENISATLKKLFAFIADERKIIILVFALILINATMNLLGPIIIGHTIDTYIKPKQYQGVVFFSMILFCVFIVAMITTYLQTKIMGKVGQHMLFNLRNALFNKIQDLPLDFFNQNKVGDLISRINSDTDKLNQFISQSLIQFLSSIFVMFGAVIFLLSINLRLGAAALVPALFLWIFTKGFSPWVKTRNALSLKKLGEMSAEIQESLNNFKVIIVFNRRDYFRNRFEEINRQNYSTAVKAGLANNIFTPVYSLSANIGQLIVLVFGIYLIAKGLFSIGLLISFLAYINFFYNPLQQIAVFWANFQIALAAWDRVSRILSLENNLDVIEDKEKVPSSSLLSFKDVSFTYPNGKNVLHHINFELERGKTYAFVGPTGGGKTTIALLIARLYDATKGSVIFDGKDIRSYDVNDRTRKIGFILQDPFLFSGTIRENILYGNEEYKNCTKIQLEEAIKDAGFESLLENFEDGLDTKIQTMGEGVSLGQKQLIAFMRAVLRRPELLILDEATANVDTVTEQLLEGVLQKFPETKTRVIIAHRLNTIENADEIFFVNSGKVLQAGSVNEALNLLLHEKRES
jgi:ATP-binding cassette, subfamily B, bacterial